MVLKSAQDKSAFTQQLIFTTAARIAFKHLLKILDIKSPGKIFLPSYIGYTEREGSGVFDPVEETLTPYEFYKVNNSLGFDLDDVKNVFKTGNIKAILVIHYFGFNTININQLQELCSSYNVLLIEDCAHAFQLGFGHQTLGNNGDFSFYSLHKYLATDSGGILRVNNNDFAVPDVSDESRISREILEQYIKTDLVAIAQKRIQNYLLYQQELQEVKDIEIMFTLSEGIVPQTFPIRVKGGLREKLYFFLINKGLPTTALYYRLIDKISKEIFPLSFQLAGEILNLPVHQDTTTEDIINLTNAIKEFFIVQGAE